MDRMQAGALCDHIAVGQASTKGHTSPLTLAVHTAEGTLCSKQLGVEQDAGRAGGVNWMVETTMGAGWADQAWEGAGAVADACTKSCPSS